MGRLLRRAPVLIALVVAIGAFLLFGPKLPREQALRISLGEDAPAVREVWIRYRERDSDEVVREVSFRYPSADAPRVVRHEPRLADGDYLLEIELLTLSTRATVRKTVGLYGASTSIDVASQLRATGDAGSGAGAKPGGALP